MFGRKEGADEWYCVFQVDADMKLEQEFCHSNRYWITCSILLVRYAFVQ